MTAPSWRQLRAIPESLTKRQILHALGVEPPPEGISVELDLGGDLRFQAGDGGLICYAPGRGGCFYTDPKDAIRRFRLSKGTPSGDLFRRWLEAHGLL